MKFIALYAALAALPAVLANLSINTPASVVACQPTQFTWSGGTAPYYVSIVPAGQPTAPATEQFPTQNGTSYTWNVNLAQGTSITVVCKDSNGDTAYSSIITVTAGTTDSCVTGSASSGSSPASTGSSASGATTTGASSPTGASGSSAAPSSSSSASGSTSTKSSGADRLGVSSAFGVAAVMGLVGAAMF